MIFTPVAGLIWIQFLSLLDVFSYFLIAFFFVFLFKRPLKAFFRSIGKIIKF